MRIRFDPDFDRGAWPGPLAERDAVAGEAWLGPLGLLEHLETMLGLLGPASSSQERSAALAARLPRQRGFWSDSSEVDALGSARELLRWRDELVLAGWRGEPAGMPRRVAALAEVTRDLRPGVPDRVWAVVDTLASRAGDPDILECLELLDPREAHPIAWQQVFQALEAHGTRVDPLDLPPATGSGDLAAARSDGDPFGPAGDGTLQLLRPDGPWEAAEEVAAWLAAQPDLEGTVIVTPTPLLDTELRRFGLPTTGARGNHAGGGLLEVLPLALALGWSPADPQDAVELLSLARGPVPRGVAGRLLGALGEWPAVGSDAWERGLMQGLEAIDDESRRTRVAERVEGLFRPSVRRVDGDRYPLSEVRRRIELVQQWLGGGRGVAERDGGGPEAVAPWDQALAHCTVFERLVALSAVDTWSEAELHRYLEEARATLPGEPGQPAQAGLSAVASPAAIAGPARCIVWWGFERAAATRPRRLPFSRAERESIAAAGIALPDPADEALRLARRWRRPLEQAERALVLVAPRRDEAGEESHPHPLWDEVRARAPDSTGADLITAPRLHPMPGSPATQRSARPLALLPGPQRFWQVPPDLVSPRETESNTSVGTLVRCPFQWALRYPARLYAGGAADVEVSPRVLGNLAHALLEDVMPAAQGDPAQAAQRAGTWFDDIGPLRVAGLFLPGQEDHRARVRRLLCDAARFLAGFLEESGLEVVATERRLEGTGLGRTLAGRLDLELGPRPVVIDAKWGGLRWRRDALRKGTAAQLAFYAHLLRQQTQIHPAVAFFVLSEQGLLTTDPDLPRPAEHIDGPDPAQTWLALARAFDARAIELAGGRLEATASPDSNGETGPDSDEVDDGGRLILRPQCGYCDYGGLCGVELAEAGGAR